MAEKLDSLKPKSPIINCSDAYKCFFLKDISNQYNINRMVERYCSKAGLGCSEKALIIREDLGIKVDNLY
jgi:hypothetical protein